MANPRLVDRQSAPRASWYEFIPVISAAAILMGAAAVTGGASERLTTVEKQVIDLKAREDQRDKDQQANSDKLNAIDGRTIRIETTLSLLTPEKDKAP